MSRCVRHTSLSFAEIPLPLENFRLSAGDLEVRADGIHIIPRQEDPTDAARRAAMRKVYGL